MILSEVDFLGPLAIGQENLKSYLLRKKSSCPTLPNEVFFKPCYPSPVNPLSPKIQVQILQSDLHTFPIRISWENLMKDQGIFLFSDHFINSHNLSSWKCVDNVRRNFMLITIGTKRVKTVYSSGRITRELGGKDLKPSTFCLVGFDKWMWNREQWWNQGLFFFLSCLKQFALFVGHGLGEGSGGIWNLWKLNR